MAPRPRLEPDSGGSLAQAYRRFAEADAAGTSPLYERVALALSGSADDQLS